MPNSSSAAEVRPSSTVVIARAANKEPEVLMVRRSERGSFARAHVFPGGVLDPDDWRVASHCVGIHERTACQRLGIEKDGLAYFSAAIRETFEETGILFADCSSIDENLQTVRDALNDGTLRWADFVMENKLQLRCDALHYIAHWVTPPHKTRRFTTRFFVAELPQGQDAMHCGGELTDSTWATARSTLRAGRHGRIELHFPTIKTLESVARHKSMPELLEWAESRVEWGVTSMVPVMIERNGKLEMVLPGDKDYPGSRL